MEMIANTSPATVMRAGLTVPTAVLTAVPTVWTAGGTRLPVADLSNARTRAHAVAANTDVPSYFQTIKSVKSAPPPRVAPR